ncbi:tetratricopeptide repeat protein [Persicimonas caeni]|uniref:tetratricopeptide repeat protein n=1 Tax=Persicimonas caeni TaxID=2292766 RepID=UPI00143CCFF1|nr:tetratricopeptide repeat protein [Persicimonas caeni]
MEQRLADIYSEGSTASRHESSAQLERLSQQRRNTTGDPSDWIALANRLEDQGRADEAADALARAAGIDLRHGQFNLALERLQRAIELAPSRAASHYELAKTHHQLGRFAQAFDAYGRAYEHFSSTQRRKRSKEVLERMIRLKPDDIELHLERARGLEEDGEFKDALDIYRQCADELERSGSTEEFLELTEHMLELAPDQPHLRARVVDALLAEADAFLNYGLEERAKQDIERALTHAPDSLHAHIRLVRLYERLRQPMAFIDSVTQMARAAQGGRALAAKALRRAQEWMGSSERIDALADKLEVDLSDVSEELPPQLDSDSESELGDEETAPRDQTMPAFARESTRNHGVILGGAGRAHNLLTLLQAVERSQEPSQLLIEDGEGNPIAELRARDRRLEVGLRLDGEIFVDRSLKRVSTDLADRLADSGANADACLTTSNTTTGERSQLYRLTARGLVELATRAESQHFCLRSRSMEPAEHDHLSFSPFALTLRAAGYMHSDTSKVAAHFYDKMGESSEEAWLLVDPEDGSKMCLPLRSVSTTPLTIAELRKLGRRSFEILEYNRKTREALGSQETMSTSFSMNGGLWCAVSSGAHLALVRAEMHKMGATLSQARSATNSGGEA